MTQRARRLLVVSPHFPPVDAVDMHRVRTNVAAYRVCGWEPTLLCVEPEATGRLIDLRLVAALPEDLEIVRVRPREPMLARLAGITAIGLRALGALAEAGDELLRRRRFDLAFFSTTAFPAMTLGPRWKTRFGLPFVLDFQDPWSAAPPSALPFRRLGLKHRAMRALHRRLERSTVPEAAGLIAVSQSYIDVLHQHYPAVARRPFDVVPFGFSAADIAIARREGVAWDAIARVRERARLVGLSAGSHLPQFDESVSTLLRIVSEASRASTPVLSRLDLLFLGTGYAKDGNPQRVVPLARKAGLPDRVVERPDRIPLYDAFRSIDEVDLLIVFGSDDTAYQPSKLYQYLALERPILVVASRESPIMALTAGLPGVVRLEAGTAPSEAAAWTLDRDLQQLLSLPCSAFRRDGTGAAEYSAETLAARECALFERALA